MSTEINMPFCAVTLKKWTAAKEDQPEVDIGDNLLFKFLAFTHLDPTENSLVQRLMTAPSTPTAWRSLPFKSTKRL